MSAIYIVNQDREFSVPLVENACIRISPIIYGDVLMGHNLIYQVPLGTFDSEKEAIKEVIEIHQSTEHSH